jgi:hypothetical protein
VVPNQPWQIVWDTLSRKNPSQKRADGVAQGVGPEFKPQYRIKKRRAVKKFPHSHHYGSHITEKESQAKV